MTRRILRYVLILAVVGTFTVAYLTREQRNTVEAVDSIELQAAIVYSSSAAEPNDKTFLLLGDTSFGENYQEPRRKNILKAQGYDYSLANFRAVLASADRVLANLETPVTELRDSDLAGDKWYIHWADPLLTPLHLARHRIRYLSLANNHTMDLGVDGLRHTITALSAQGLHFFGAGLNRAEAERPLVWNFHLEDTVRRVYVFAGFEYNSRHKRFRFYADETTAGVNRLDRGAMSRSIAEVRRDDPSALIVCFPHWGKDYTKRTRLQQQMAHAWIDAGGDLVVGHGAHMAQRVERYRDRWIVYSLGDFMFNSGGQYARFNVPPISLIARGVLAPAGSSLLREIRLYPIFTNNRVTNFQSRFVDQGEFETAVKLVASRIYPHDKMSFGKDDFGSYIRLHP